jgi:DNA-damage-inducible protein D
LIDTEKELTHVIFEQTGGNESFALIRSKGDQALFGQSTQSMKARWRVPDNRPLADFAPTIILKAKDFATEITIHNIREKNMRSEPQISREHITRSHLKKDSLDQARAKTSGTRSPKQRYWQKYRDAGRQSSAKLAAGRLQKGF